MKIPAATLDALRAATTDGPNLYLTGPRMAPKLYQRIDEIIEGAGGQWDKRAGAHVFPGDAAEAIAVVLATGAVTTLREARAASQFFPTPASVVTRLVELAELTPGMEVLEPSAGRGAIATALADAGALVDCIEQDPGHAAALQATGTARAVRVADFLTVPEEVEYDRVVMNPPFTKGADIAHVTHALRFLKPDGLLTAVMSGTVSYQAGDAARFRALVEQRGGTVEVVPEGAFAKSGTDVSTLLVTVPATTRPATAPVVWVAPPKAPEAAGEGFGNPAEIAAEIAANLREALAIMEGLARDLAIPLGQPAGAIELPAPPWQEQLTFETLRAAP